MSYSNAFKMFGFQLQQLYLSKRIPIVNNTKKASSILSTLSFLPFDQVSEAIFNTSE